MRILWTWVAVLATALATGCTNLAPIQNIDNATVVGAAGKSLNLDQVKESIMLAGGALGWRMQDTSPGHIIGTLILRTHTAVVDIPYSTSSYSIVYKSSIDLREGGGQIHKNYNGWVSNLNRGISTQLSMRS